MAGGDVRGDCGGERRRGNEVKTRSGAIKSIVDRYWEIAELLDESMEEGKEEFQGSKLKTKSSIGKDKETSRYIYLYT